MLIHITPSMYLNLAPDLAALCALHDVEIPELGIHLLGDRDVVARRPFPNKKYIVACRKAGQKAIAGIFVDSPTRLASFTVVTRWRTLRGLHAHTVKYEVQDNDFDAVSDQMVLWSRWESHGLDWKNRWPERTKEWTPAAAQPRMDFWADEGRVGDVRDSVNADGVVINRLETFPIPTLERERLLVPTSLAKRLPNIADAFGVAG